MIYRLHVTYSDKVSFPMFIKDKCLIWCDSRCHFRLLSALPVKSFQIALFFYSSLVYMHPIFCRYFLFLMIGNILLWRIHNQNKLVHCLFEQAQIFLFIQNSFQFSDSRHLCYLLVYKVFVSNMKTVV